MSVVTVADVLRYCAPLAPVEATALTLAVARELDEQRAAGQPASVPGDAAIILHRDGDVSLLNHCSASSTDDVEALSLLLARLLGIARPEDATRVHEKRMSPPAFRAALAGATSVDPAVLAAVHWRVAGAIRNGRPAAAVRRVERRGKQPTATELRRSIRHLEHQLFNARERLVVSRVRSRRMRRFTSLAWAAAASLAVVAAFAALAAVRPAVPERPSLASAAFPGVTTGSSPQPVTAIAAAAPSSSRVASTGPVATLVRHPHVRPPRQRSASTVRRAEPAVLFPGGTRSISWTVAGR